MEKVKNKLRNKKFLVKFIGVAVVFITIMSLAIYQLVIVPRLSQDTYVYKEATVERGDIVLGIEESGSVTLEESELSYDLTITTDDEDDDDDDDEDDDDDDDEESSKNLEVEEVYVSMGQRIAEGDQLFKLTESSVSSVQRLLESNLAEAKIALSEANEEYNIGVLEADNTRKETNVTAADASSLYNASVDELKAEISSYTGEIEALTAEIGSLQEDLTDEELLESLNTAYLEFVAAQNTFNDSDVQNFGAYTANKQALDTAEEAYEKIQDEIESMNEQIEDDREQIEKDQLLISQANAALEFKVQEAGNTYESSSLSGDMADEVYSYTVNSLQESVDEAQNDLDLAQEELDAFTAFVGDDGIICANGSGIVTAVNYEAGDDLEETGAMVTYAKEDSFTVSIDVSEEDIKAVNVGDSVTLTFSAYDDESWEGEVSAITTSVSDNHSTTVSYPVTIDVLGDTSELYGGMTADVTFVSDSVSDVLYVSAQAVEYENDKAYVYVKSGNDYVQKEISVGFSNGSSIEVTDGLEEGDTVYIRSKVSASQESLMDKLTQTGTGDENTSEDGENTDSPDGQMGEDMQMPGDGGMPSGGDMPSGGGMPSGGFPGGAN